MSTSLGNVMSNLSDRDRKIIAYLRRYSSKVPVSQMAKHLGLCKTSVYRRLAILGLSPVKPPVLTTKQRNYILNHYMEMSFRQIAAICHCSQDSIRDYLRSVGLQKDRRGVPHVDKRGITTLAERQALLVQKWPSWTEYRKAYLAEWAKTPHGKTILKKNQRRWRAKKQLDTLTSN